MTLCKFIRVGDEMVCEHGLLRIPVANDQWGPERYHGRCEANAPDRVPLTAEEIQRLRKTAAEQQEKLLGDHTRDVLESVGISKEFYIGVKDALGFAPTCDCDGRVEWINDAHRVARRLARRLIGRE